MVWYACSPEIQAIRLLTLILRSSRAVVLQQGARDMTLIKVPTAVAESNYLELNLVSQQ